MANALKSCLQNKQQCKYKLSCAVRNPRQQMDNAKHHNVIIKLK